MVKRPRVVPFRFTPPLAALACAAFAVGVMFAPASPARAAEPATKPAGKPIKALLVTGGCCHDYKKQKDILTAGISARANVEWTIVHEGDGKTNHRHSVYEKADWAAGYDVVVHDECSADVKDQAFVDNVLKPHKDGVPAVLLHCAMHNYRVPKWDGWFELCGIQSSGHGPQEPIVTTYVAKDHPIVKGLGDWTTIKEELYNNVKVFDTITPIARGKQGKADTVVAWTNTYNGKTRVFATTLGHNNTTVQDDRYLDLVTRGLLWSLDKLDDQHFKPVQKPAADLSGPKGSVGAAGKAGASAPAAPAAGEAGATTAPTTPAARAAGATRPAIAPPFDAEANRRKITAKLKAPPGFDVTLFAAPPDVGYPTCLAAAPTGELYVGIDEQGSLGREPGRGRIVRCTDTDGDGKADQFVTVAKMDHPRGVFIDGPDLYVLHPPFLTVFHDDTGDGIADRSDVLVKDIVVPETQRSRGADHTTNGFRVGIDGWVYIAVGDFGCTKAIGKDGATLQHYGGGVVRVRLDGSGLESYSRGQRNIYDVAVSPLLDVFTRDNTNDGGGWNVRLSHVIPTGHYGYPSLFKNFPDEIVQPLADYGGGSPCGALYVSEPNLPGPAGDALYTVEWGQSAVFRHPLTPAGAGFKATQEKFFDISRGTDMDMDGLGRLYVSSWANGGFNYSGPDVGYVVRLAATGAKPAPFPNLTKSTDDDLLAHLASPSAVRRFYAQREMLRRKDKPLFAAGLEKLALSTEPPPVRVAALLTLKQLRGDAANAALARLAARDDLREYALRALADRPGDAAVPSKLFADALADANPRVRLQAAWGLGRLGATTHAPALLPLTADADPLVAHVAVNALVALRAAEPCLTALDSSNPKVAPGALRVLQSLHQPAVVEGLIVKLPATQDPTLRNGILRALCRLYWTEAQWTGSWWGTRPDTTGPYFRTAAWAGTPRVQQALLNALSTEKGDALRALVTELQRHKVTFPELLPIVAKAAETDPAFKQLLVQLLIEQPTLTPEQIATVRATAVSDQAPPALRAKAIKSLSRINAPAAADAAIDALASIVAIEKPDNTLTAALDEYIRDPRHGKNIPAFAKLLQSPAAPKRELAGSVLATIATSKLAKPDAKTAAGAAIENAWSRPAWSASMLRAIGRTRATGFDDWIEAMVADPDAGVATAAAYAAKRLGVKHGPVADPSTKMEILALGYDKAIGMVQGMKGEPKFGRESFEKLGCIACHTTSPDEAPKGPYLVGVATRYSRAELAESVLKPSAKIAQGFENQYFELKDGDLVEGFIVREAADEVEVRNAGGIATIVKLKTVKERGKRQTSVMPEALADKLTAQDFAHLMAYLESLKAK